MSRLALPSDLVNIELTLTYDWAFSVSKVKFVN
jgi:hypothetical protein